LSFAFSLFQQYDKRVKCWSAFSSVRSGIPTSTPARLGDTPAVFPTNRLTTHFWPSCNTRLCSMPRFRRIASPSWASPPPALCAPRDC